MTAYEFSEAVQGAGRACQDRFVVEVAFDVACEVVGGGVAAGAIFFEGLEGDPVEVALEEMGEAGGVGAAACGDPGLGFGREVAKAAGRGERILFTKDAAEAVQACACEFFFVEGCVADEKFVEEDAEAVDVCAGVEVGGAEVGLFRAHVGRCAEEGAEFGVEGFVGERVIEGLGDAEVDDLGAWGALVKGDEDVGGFDVAVDDAFLVGVLDGVADLEEESETFGHGETVAVAVFGDAQAGDQLHDEEGPAGGGGAGVEDAGDVRVVHEGQRLALGLESSDDGPAVHAGFEDFESDAAADGGELLGQEDDADAALADFFEQLVGADAVAGFFDRGERGLGPWCGGGEIGVQELEGRGFEEGIVAVVLEEGFDGGTEGGIERADAFQVGGSGLRRGLMQRFEKGVPFGHRYGWAGGNTGSLKHSCACGAGFPPWMEDT